MKQAATRMLRALAGPLWRWPVVLGALSAFGLVSALVGDGLWDALSWLALAPPAAVAAWCAWRRSA